MWIFTKEGFLSIVQYGNTPDILLVRSRFKGHIERIFGVKAEVGVKTDYEYRAKIAKAKVSKAISKLVDDIDYGNFKEELCLKTNDDRLYVLRCWAVYEALSGNSTQFS
jgi:hypothetical protein